MPKTLILTVQNQPGPSPFCGREFNVVLVQKGDQYGLNDCLTHTEESPMIEFYDARHIDRPEFQPFGQFVSRYYISTLFDPTYGSVARGLDLWGDVKEWKLDSMAMEKVLRELRRRFNIMLSVKVVAR